MNTRKNIISISCWAGIFICITGIVFFIVNIILSFYNSLLINLPFLGIEIAVGGILWIIASALFETKRQLTCDDESRQ